jgi:hypothetical protein
MEQSAQSIEQRARSMIAPVKGGITISLLVAPATRSIGASLTTCGRAWWPAERVSTSQHEQSAFENGLERANDSQATSPVPSRLSSFDERRLVTLFG